MTDRLGHDEIQKMSLDEMIQSIQNPALPQYDLKDIKIVSNLHYSWDAWMSGDKPFPHTLEKAVALCEPLWAGDGFLLENFDLDSTCLKCLFNVSPDISAVLFSQRVKGRLDHAFRQLGTPVKFSRKVGFRALGDNTREIVNQYVEKQVGKSDYVDVGFKKFLDDFTVVDRTVDLYQPESVAHGRYWNNIHLVLVIDDRRYPMTKKETFETVKDSCFKIASKYNHHIAHLAVMPDHIHISLRVNPQISPENLGLCYLNNLAFSMGRHRCLSEEFYVGTFSEYSLDQL